jgi:hypothetical protein
MENVKILIVSNYTIQVKSNQNTMEVTYAMLLTAIV